MIMSLVMILCSKTKRNENGKDEAASVYEDMSWKPEDSEGRPYLATSKSLPTGSFTCPASSKAKNVGGGGARNVGQIDD